VTADDIEAVVRMAAGNPNVRNNPKPVGEAEARAILEAAF
jgi:alcohol dehydrogenase class IV